jgi:hypothetical protein
VAETPIGSGAHHAIAIWSGFGVWDVRPKKADLFVRADHVQGRLGDVETVFQAPTESTMAAKPGGAFYDVDLRWRVVPSSQHPFEPQPRNGKIRS